MVETRSSSGPEPEWPTGHGGGRMVVGVDGSSGSTAALLWAVHEAAMHNNLLEVVTCHNGSGDSASSRAAENLNQLVDDALAASGQETLTAIRSVVEGHPARTLVKLGEGAELLVVGSRGLGAIASTLLGSVSMHVVTHASCTVVVVADPLHAATRSGRRYNEDEAVLPSQAASWRAIRGDIDYPHGV